jgi:hypothetical protein
MLLPGALPDTLLFLSALGVFIAPLFAECAVAAVGSGPAATLTGFILLHSFGYSA